MVFSENTAESTLPLSPTTLYLLVGWLCIGLLTAACFIISVKVLRTNILTCVYVTRVTTVLQNAQM